MRSEEIEKAGECCRRAFRRGVETMQEHVAKTGPDMAWVRSMPLPEEAVTPTAHDPQRYFALGKKAGAEAMREAAAAWLDMQITAPHFTAQLKLVLVDAIRRLPLPGAKEGDR